MFKRLILLPVALLFMAVAGCETVSKVTQPIGTSTMTELSKKSAQARVGYLGFLELSTVYMKRPRCGAPSSPVLCSSQEFIDDVLVPTRVSFGEATKASERAVANMGDNPTLATALVESAVSASKAAAEISTKIGGK